MQYKQQAFIGFELRTALTLKELGNENGELWVGRDWVGIAHGPILWFHPNGGLEVIEKKEDGARAAYSLRSRLIVTHSSCLQIFHTYPTYVSSHRARLVLP